MRDVGGIELFFNAVAKGIVNIWNKIKDAFGLGPDGGRDDPPPPPPSAIPVSSIIVNGESEVGIGKSIQLTATVSPNDASDKRVTWSSGNTSIATVNQNGVVIGKGTGSVTITATAWDGSKKQGNKEIKVNTYHRETQLKNVSHGPNLVVQGFAVGTNFCYSLEVDYPAYSMHKLYQYNIITNNGDPIEMTPIRNPKSPYQDVGRLGHANDMALVSYKENGVDCFFMYVVAYDGGMTPVIVKLQYSGTNYWEVGRYKYPGGSDSYTVYSGISNMGPEKDANGNNGIKFLLKVANSFSTVIIPYDQGNDTTLSKTTNKFVKDAFSIPAYSNYDSQGVHYENTGTGKIYAPYWGSDLNPNANVIRVYSNINSNNPIFVNTFETNSGASTNVLFEIEGCGFPSNNNVLWFNTNEGIYGGTKINGGIYTESRAIK